MEKSSSQIFEFFAHFAAYRKLKEAREEIAKARERERAQKKKERKSQTEKKNTREKKKECEKRFV